MAKTPSSKSAAGSATKSHKPEHRSSTKSAHPAAKAKGSSKAHKRAAKSKKKAVKAASKIRVRGGEEKKSKSTNTATRKKFKAVGHAPHSARITATRGPMKKAAVGTLFAPAINDERKWLLVDASGQIVGRLASEIAMLLRGKHKPSFTPHADAGDFVVVINVDKVRFSRDKEETKRYYQHSGWIGGMKVTSPAKLRPNHPERILESAVKGMISRTPLGRHLMGKLKIYRGSEHPHKAQVPVLWQLRHSTQRR